MEEFWSLKPFFYAKQIRGDLCLSFGSALFPYVFIVFGKKKPEKEGLERETEQKERLKTVKKTLMLSNQAVVDYFLNGI